MLLLYIAFIYFFQISGSIRLEIRIIEVQNPRGFEYIFVIIVVFAINQYAFLDDEALEWRENCDRIVMDPGEA